MKIGGTPILGNLHMKILASKHLNRTFRPGARHLAQLGSSPDAATVAAVAAVAAVASGASAAEAMVCAKESP